MTEHDITDM